MALNFELRSVKCFFTTLAEARSLNSMITWRVGLVVLVDTMYCWSDTLESMNCLTVKCQIE